MNHADSAPLASVVRALMRHPFLVFGLPFMGGVLGIVWVLLTRQHLSEATFAPQSSQQQGGRLTGLASQLGLPFNLGGDVESPDFYRAVLLSLDLSAEAAQSEFRFAITRGGTDSLMGTYLDLYKVKGKTELERVSRGARRLRRSLQVGQDRQANVVSLRVRSKWPEFSEFMAQRIIQLVNEFNLKKRQSRARAEREFLEGRVAQIRQELAEAEGAQRRFLERNRVYQGDPDLTFQYQSLTRRVDQVQQAFTNVIQAYEQARIEEVRNTPVITVVQGPLGSARPSSRLSGGAFLGFFLGGLFALVAILISEYAARERALVPAAYRDIEALGEKLARRLLPRATRETGS